MSKPKKRNPRMSRVDELLKAAAAEQERESEEVKRGVEEFARRAQLRVRLVELFQLACNSPQPAPDADATWADRVLEFVAALREEQPAERLLDALAGCPVGASGEDPVGVIGKDLTFEAYRSALGGDRLAVLAVTRGVLTAGNGAQYRGFTQGLHDAGWLMLQTIFPGLEPGGPITTIRGDVEPANLPWPAPSPVLAPAIYMLPAGRQPHTPAREEPESDGLALAPGGFSLCGTPHQLTGRPLAVLGVLLKARHRTATVGQLREQLGVDEVAVEHPNQVIKGAASDLRKALCRAYRAAGLSCPKNPVPSWGRGNDLTYRLDLQ
jgi:hypothetical protein